MARLFNLIDEITLAVFFPFAIMKLYENREIFQWQHIVLFCSIAMLALSGFISGMVNGNSILITMHGTIHYIKYFFVIFIYAAFIRDVNEFKKIFHFLLVVAVFVGFVAFIEEVFALYIRYIFEKDVNGDRIIMLINKLFTVSNSGHRWRLGVYRSSFLFHYNLIGLYSLFILTFYLHIVKKLNIVIIFALLAGIFTSVSRTSYMGFALLAGLQIYKGRRWLIVFMTPVVLALFFMLFPNYVNDYKTSSSVEEKSYQENTASQPMNEVSFREYARKKAILVWKDHPNWGVGPGMFGGAVAYKTKSHYYYEYNFTIILNWFHSLEQLWPQVLAEMGIIGTAALAGLFISMLVIFFISSQQSDSDGIKDIFTGLLSFTIIFLIYTSSGNLNIVAIMFLFCAFAGMGIGCLGDRNR